MVVGDSTKGAYSEFAEAAAERAVQGGGSVPPQDTKQLQRPPTNVDGAPPGLTTKFSSTSNTNGSSGSTPWVIGSNVRPNNGILSPTRPEPLTVAEPNPNLGGAPTRFGSISGGSARSAENSGLLSRAATLAPPRQMPSRGMTISRSRSTLAAPYRSASVSPARPARPAPSPSPTPALALVPAPADPGYDDILGEYGDGGEASPPRRRPTMGGAGPGRAMSTRASPSPYAPNTASGPRSVQRQRTMGSMYSRSVRAISVYDEDGEIPLRLIKVKVRSAQVPATSHPLC
jgi:hypothetical protein